MCRNHNFSLEEYPCMAGYERLIMCDKYEGCPVQSSIKILSEDLEKFYKVTPQIFKHPLHKTHKFKKAKKKDEYTKTNPLIVITINNNVLFWIPIKTTKSNHFINSNFKFHVFHRLL